MANGNGITLIITFEIHQHHHTIPFKVPSIITKLSLSLSKSQPLNIGQPTHYLIFLCKDILRSISLCNRLPHPHFSNNILLITSNILYNFFFSLSHLKFVCTSSTYSSVYIYIYMMYKVKHSINQNLKFTTQKQAYISLQFFYFPFIRSDQNLISY